MPLQEANEKKKSDKKMKNKCKEQNLTEEGFVYRQNERVTVNITWLITNKTLIL